MKSPNIKYLPAVDHLRGFAAALIVFYHGLHLISYEMKFNAPFSFSPWPETNNPFLAVLIEGHTAVALFMVLSGFIFAYGALGREIAYLPFIRNRFLRIGRPSSNYRYQIRDLRILHQQLQAHPCADW